MEITSREAARRLHHRHRLSRDVSRRVLAAGLAGYGRRIAGALLLDERRVDALLDRHVCEPRVLDRWRPLIVRLGRDRPWHVDDDWGAQARVAGSGWYVTRRLARALADRHPLPVPLVATLGGFVVFGADIVGSRMDEGPFTPTRARAHPTSSFELEPPTHWWDDVEGTWLPINNGPTWTLWGAPTTTPRIDSLRADVDDQRRRLEIAEMTTSTGARRLDAAYASHPELEDPGDRGGRGDPESAAP